MTLYGIAPAYTMTSKEEVTRLLSLRGVQAWSDDLSVSDAEEFMLECVYDATETVLQYVELMYDAEDLASSYWVRRRATYIAAYNYTKRRGDPGLYGEDYQRAISELELVTEGLLQIPGLARSSGMAAVMQNIVVDQRFLHAKIRVRPTISTDLSGKEFLTTAYPYEWL